MKLENLGRPDEIREIPEYYEKANLFHLVCFCIEFKYGFTEESWYS